MNSKPGSVFNKCILTKVRFLVITEIFPQINIIYIIQLNEAFPELITPWQLSVRKTHALLFMSLSRLDTLYNFIM